MELFLMLALVASSPSQERSIVAPPRRSELAPPTTFVGRVLTPEGRPAPDVEVTTSAGGACVTAADGGFELVVDVPGGAREVEVSALAQRRASLLTASARVVPASLAPTTPVGVLVLAPSLPGRTRWLDEFDDPSGADDFVEAFATFDDGQGLALYAGGEFSRVGGVQARGVARWNGARWSSLDGGTSFDVLALTTIDVGSGPALYVGGSFSHAGGVLVNNIARWDGEAWSALGAGVQGMVDAITAFDHGDGPALYVGGTFTSAGGVPANRIAKWDGDEWHALGSGVDGAVLALAEFDDGSGPALYVGGAFTTAGGTTVNRIARWDGAAWSALGSGIWPGPVNALAVHDEGDGPALFVGGAFLTAGGASANRIARWDGTSWSTLGSGLTGAPEALAVFDDGTGPALYAGGAFHSVNVQRWNGSTWTQLTSVSHQVMALCPFGSELYAGGTFVSLSGMKVNHIARYDGSDWSPLGGGLDGTPTVTCAFDDGGGARLYAGGAFTFEGGAEVEYVGRWDGSAWSSVGGGLSDDSLAMCVFDDGNGPELCVGGTFTSAGGTTVNGIASWDGSSWSALGSGMGGSSPTVWALAVFDDGSGPALHAGGDFTSAGGTQANRIARWDGSSWSALGGGREWSVRALAEFDDGSGPALYAYGTAGPSARFARWDGSIWTDLDPGPANLRGALTAFDDGGGPALFAGGYFYVAKWDGAAWSVVGEFSTNEVLTPFVEALAVFDDGSGPALFAAGYFKAVNGSAALRIARWDGSSWSGLGRGLDTASFTGGSVESLSVYDDGNGSALIVGGHFRFSPSNDAFVAKWGRFGKVARK